MNRATSDYFDQFIANFLHTQCSCHALRRDLGQTDHALMTGQIWSLKHVYMQHVTLNPFPAIEQISKQPCLGGHSDVQRIFKSPHRAHLVSDGTNAANPGRDVWDILQIPALQESFEEAGRFVDVDFDLVGLTVFETDE
jgi:hypothetical protein